MLEILGEKKMNMIWFLHVNQGERFKINQEKYSVKRTSLVVQGRLYAPNARGPGLTFDPGIGSHMFQLRVHTLQLKISHMATKTQRI